MTKSSHTWENVFLQSNLNVRVTIHFKVAVKDHFMVAKLEVFSYIAGIVEPYLAAYQTDKPMVLFMYADLMELVKHLLKLFIKSSVIGNCKSGADIKKIDGNKINNYKKDICVGFSAENRLFELKRKDKVNDKHSSLKKKLVHFM